MNCGFGSVRVSLTVRGSTATTSLTHSFIAAEKLSFGALSRSMLIVKTTSLVVKGVPSLQVTFGRSLIVSSV